MARPRIELDSKQAEIFGYFKATRETMADFLGVSLSTISERMSTENEFSLAYKKGFADLKMKLSEAQIQTALKGNATMQIWLGKQHLEQSEPIKQINITSDVEIPQNVDELTEKEIDELYNKLKENRNQT